MTKLTRAGSAMLLALSLLLGGCLFTATLEVISIPGEGVLAVSITFNGNWLSCTPTSTPGDTATYNCAFFTPETVSSFSLSSVELLVRAFIIDPVVIQLPSTVTNVHGTFSHAAGNGNLVVQGPLASVPIDFTRSLTAEPGTSLYIVSVPEAFEDAHPTGTYSFDLGMNTPLGTTAIPAKAVIAGHVRTAGGQNYYPPLFPCVTSMAAAPGGTINTASASSTITLPSPASIQVCQNAQFSFAAAAAGPVTEIPTLHHLALAALALLLGGAAALWSRQRNR